MATRRETREWAVQLLFQLDLNPTEEIEEAILAFWEDKDVDGPSRAFTEEIVKGVRARVDELDALIARLAEHWAVERMGVLERNAIRLAVYEMYYRQDIPPVVSINEAVDIAKHFSSRDSGKFVNGILDEVRKGLTRSARHAIGDCHATRGG